MISIIPPELRFSFAIAFIFSLQTQRTVCLCCARTAGYFLVGESGALLFAAKSWLPKKGVFTRKKKSEHVAILFIYIYIWWWWWWWSFQFLSCLTLTRSLFKFLICFSMCKVLAFRNTLKESSMNSKTERISNSLSSAGPKVH